MAIKFLNNVDLGQNQLLNARIHVASSAPSGSGEGSLWLDSSNNTLKFYVADTGGGSAGFLSVLDDTNTNMSFTLTADSGSNQTISNGNTLDIAGGASITTSVGNTDTVTIDVTDNTIGAAELNVSGNGSTSQFLRSDGDGTFSWAVPTDTNTNTQNTTTLSFVDSSNDIIIRNTTGGAGSGTDDIKIVAGSNITLTHTDADNFTIASTDTNTQLSTEQVQDIVGAMFSSNTETRISATYEDGDGTIDLVVDDMTTDTNTFRTVTAGGNTLGSSETLAFTAGSNVTITESGGAVTIASTDTNTTYSVGDGGLTQNNFTNADHSKLNDIEDSADVTTTAKVKSALNASFGGSATIGDGSDTFTIPGNLIVTGDTTTASETVKIVTDNTLQFEGAAGSTASTELNLTTAQLSGSDKTVTLKNETGTIALTSDITGTNSNTNTGDQLVFKSVASDSGTAVADSTTDTLTIAGGSNVTTSVSGDTLTIASTDTNTQLSTEQVQDIVGAMFSSNTETRISATYEDGDGTIDLVVDDMTANTNTQNAYSTSVVSSSGIKLRLSGSGAAGNTTDDVKFAGSGATSVARTDASTITISSTDTNTVTTAGAGITLSGTAVSVTQFTGALAAATSGITKSSNTYTVTHGLGSGRVNVMITEVASPYAQVFPEIQFASAAGGTTCKVVFGQSVSDDSYNITVTK